MRWLSFAQASPSFGSDIESFAVLYAMPLAHVLVQRISGVGELSLIMAVERAGDFFRSEAILFLGVMQPCGSRKELADLVRCRTCGLQIGIERHGCFPTLSSRPVIPGVTAPIAVLSAVLRQNSNQLRNFGKHLV